MTNPKAPSRIDTVLSILTDGWRATSDIDDILYALGFKWGHDVTRHLLHTLHDLGFAERQRAGSGYRWRRTPKAEKPLGQTAIRAADMTPVPATAVELRDLSAQVARLAERLAEDPSAASPSEVHIGSDAALGTLVMANHGLVDRIVKRAVYQTGKELLEVLDGWIEGARENTEAGMGHRDADPEVFHASDIRTMVNDAMRLMGAPVHRLPQDGE